MGFFDRFKKKKEKEKSQGDLFRENYGKLTDRNDRIEALLEAKRISRQAKYKDDEGADGLMAAMDEAFSSMTAEDYAAFGSAHQSNILQMQKVYEQYLSEEMASGADQQTAETRALARAKYSETSERDVLFNDIRVQGGSNTNFNGLMIDAMEKGTGETADMREIAGRIGTTADDELYGGFGGKDGFAAFKEEQEAKSRQRAENTNIGDHMASKKRMEEIDLNNFANDESLPEEIRSKMGSSNASTSDIAAYKMLQNVKPEMLNDPVFVEQLNRFIGGNFASRVAADMSTKNSMTEKKSAFRGNTMAGKNFTTLSNMYIPQAVHDQTQKYAGSDPTNGANLANALYVTSDFLAGGDKGGRLANLMHVGSQGMNNEAGFDDNERSSMMMNNLVLRSIVPRFTDRAVAAGDAGDQAERQREIGIGGALMKTMKSPDEFYDPEFMEQFQNQLNVTGVTDRDGGKAPTSNSMAARSVKPAPAAAPAQEGKKKPWWKFWGK